MDEQRTVLFIRHGITEPNKRKQYTGWINPDLTKKEKERLSLIQWDYEPDLVYSSDLARAKQTASIYFPGSNISYSQLFREFHFGKFEGKTYEQLKENTTYRLWIDRMNVEGPPHGEHINDFRKRVTLGWELIQKSGLEKTAVITHGGWMREWCSLYASGLISEKSLWDIPFGSGWYSTFLIKGGTWECISLQEVRITARKNG